MKKSIIILGMLGFSLTYAQQDNNGKVGVNTETPSATLNVKSKTGTTSATKNLELENANSEKLVTVLDNGNVGVGTTTPTTKLDLVSHTEKTAFRMADGSQGEGKVLTSDANGNAIWKDNSQYLVNGTISKEEFKIPVINNSPTIGYTGSYITLPKGFWSIKFTAWLQANGSKVIRPSNQNQGFASIFFSTSDKNYTPPKYSSNIKSIIINPIYHGSNAVIGFYGSGEIPVILDQETTIYLWGFIHPVTWSELPSAPNLSEAYFSSLNSTPGSYGPYTILYATPILVKN